MVQISAGRYDRDPAVWEDRRVHDSERNREVYACRHCGGPSKPPFIYYCSTEDRDAWRKEWEPPIWAAVRREVLERDGYTCQVCGVTKETLRALRILEAQRGTTDRWIDYELEVDHILPVKTHPHLEFDKSNLRTLCHLCHAKHGARPVGRSSLENVTSLDEYP